MRWGQNTPSTRQQGVLSSKQIQTDGHTRSKASRVWKVKSALDEGVSPLGHGKEAGHLPTLKCLYP